MNIKDIIVQMMREQEYRPLKAQDFANALEINKYQKKDFYKLLDEMEKEGYIIKNTKGKYGLPEKMGYITGTVQINERGFGFLIPDAIGMRDIFLSKDEVRDIMDGDKVMALITAKEVDGKRAEAKIVKILERGIKLVVGQFQKNQNFGFVLPESKKINRDIYIPKAKCALAQDGQIVVAEIEKYPEDGKKPEGKIVEVLGFVGDKGVDVLTIIKQFALPEEFPAEVVAASEQIPESVSDEEIANRMDLRGQNIFTIDGVDAKDLDDAISVEKLANGNYKLGVHIADVSHYIKENSILDKEALNRATSVYLVDRVIPMLPPRLSNGICSLNPHVPRLTLSAFMEIDAKGKVVDHKIAETVIESVERLNYTEISDLLENKDQALKERYKHIYTDLCLAKELAEILKEKRETRGAIDFDFNEAKVILDEKGKVEKISLYERRIANRMIEEFMLICNETVSEYMYWAEMPFLYRIHEEPDPERIAVFLQFVNNFGYTFKGRGDGEIHPKELQSLLDKVKDTKEEAVINTLMLRSLKKARYSAEPEGHFGLAADYYSHFTSPIRRYPDLQIHRIIKEFINKGSVEKRVFHYKGLLPKVADQSSAMERRAEEAERESIKMKMAEYMKQFKGDTFEGIISGVTSFGMFVELENTIEGLVHVNSMDDYYTYDELNYALVGEKNKKVYKLGDTVKVKLIKVNVQKREIDFEVVD